MCKARYLFVLITFVFLSACKISTLSGKYYSEFYGSKGYTGTTLFEFNPDSTKYKYISKSHFSNRVSEGKYNSVADSIFLTDDINIDSLPLRVESFNYDLPANYNILRVKTISENEDTSSIHFEIEIDDSTVLPLENFKNDSVIVRKGFKKFRINIQNKFSESKLYGLNENMTSEYYYINKDDNAFNIYFNLDNSFFNRERFNNDTLIVINKSKFYFPKMNLHFQKKCTKKKP